jgi:hypothetical protein
MPLGHLIALISNAHLRKPVVARALEARARFLLLLGTVNTAYRKTSCIEIDPNGRLAVSEPPISLHRTASDDDKRRGSNPTRRNQHMDLCPRLGRIPSSRCQDNRHSLRAAETVALHGLDDLAPRSGGARRDRTDDLLLAKQALSQLSYGPIRRQKPDISIQEATAAFSTFRPPLRSRSLISDH